jgi:hypothetical protein
MPTIPYIYLTICTCQERLRLSMRCSHCLMSEGEPRTSGRLPDDLLMARHIIGRCIMTPCTTYVRLTLE